MRWIVENEVFQDEDEPLIEALENLGIDCIATKLGTSYEDYIRDIKDENVVLHGSLQFVKKALKNTNWLGVYCNLPQFECLYYYPRFGGHLLNSEYMMLPYGELDRKIKWLSSVYGERIFVRPSSGYKTFTGKVVNVAKWDSERNSFGLRLEPEALVIVAPVKKVVKEWRNVIFDKEIIASSQYMENGEIHKDSDVPNKVLEYGESVLKDLDYSPDPMWTLDICETEDGKLSVMEVGSFSCSGFYCCDPYAIIHVVNGLFGM